MKKNKIKSKYGILRFLAVFAILCQLFVPNTSINAEVRQQQDFIMYRDTEGFEIQTVELANPQNQGYRLLSGSKLSVTTNPSGYKEMNSSNEGAFDDIMRSIINNTSKNSYIFTFTPNLSDRIIVKYIGAGEVNGQKIDIVVTNSDFIQDSSGNAPSLEIAKQLFNGYVYSGIQQYTQQWDIYLSGTSTPVDVGNNSYVTFNSLNNMEYVGPISGFSGGALLTDDTNVMFTQTTITGVDAYRGMNSNFTDSVGTPTFTRNSAQLQLQSSSFKTYVGSDWLYSGVWNSPSSGTINMPNPILPTKNVSDSNEKNVELNSLSTIHESFSYELVQQTHDLGNQLLTFYNDFSYTDQIDSVLNIESNNVKVEYAKVNSPNSRIDVTNQFNITYSNNAENRPNNILVSANKTMLENNDFYGSFIYVTIPVKVNIQYFADNIDKYKDGILNDATVFINSHDNFTNSVTTIPFIDGQEITKTVEGEASKELINRDDLFTWEVKAGFGVDVIDWTKVEITDQINDLLDIKDIRIVDENDTDVTSKGTLDTTNNLVTFTLNQENGSFTYLAGHTYTLYIDSQIKSSATPEELSPYIKDGGIPNQATLAFGDGSETLVSEQPRVTPPTEEPVIKKTVEGKTSEDVQHLDLTNREDAFNWNVTTSFGNATSDWETATLEDQINNVLEILSVKVIDQKGTDVTSTGTLTMTNNKVVFAMNKVDGSYTYLAGQIYIMTIETKIKSDVTEEELAPYIKDGGIPNQATLAFGNTGEVIASEIPTVTPPAEKSLPNTGEEIGARVFSILLLGVGGVLLTFNKKFKKSKFAKK